MNYIFLKNENRMFTSGTKVNFYISHNLYIIFPGTSIYLILGLIEMNNVASVKKYTLTYSILFVSFFPPSKSIIMDRKKHNNCVLFCQNTSMDFRRCECAISIGQKTTLISMENINNAEWQL